MNFHRRPAELVLSPARRVFCWKLVFWLKITGELQQIHRVLECLPSILEHRVFDHFFDIGFIVSKHAPISPWHGLHQLREQGLHVLVL